jgi:hypothetical protein
MSRWITTVALVAAFAAVPAYAQKPQIQWNKMYDFSKVHTFKWQTPASPSLKDSNPFMHQFIEQQIEAKLMGAGLTKTDGNPDVFVTYHGSTQTDVQLHTDSFGYGIGGYGMGGWGMYGYAGPVSSTTRVVEYEKGTLVVDIVDPAKKELVWRGTVNGILISDDQNKTQKAVGKAIDAMAKQNQKLRAQAAKDAEKAAKAKKA